MTVHINGIATNINEGQTLDEVIAAFPRQGRIVIVELNGELASSDRWHGIRLQDGDTLELVEIVGGG